MSASNDANLKGTVTNIDLHHKDDSDHVYMPETSASEVEIKYVHVIRTVPDRFIETAKQILNKVIDFGQKKGFLGLSYTVEPCDPIFFGENHIFTILCSNFQITQPVIRMGDFDLIAKIEHGSKGEFNLLRRGELQEVPEFYLDCEPDCQHCHTKRDRNITWVVKNKNTQEFSQVGTSCISEYTLYDDANAAIRYFDVLNDMHKILAAYYNDQYGLDEEGSSFGGKINFDYSVNHVIATTLAIIARENNTYLSTSKAFELKTLSTAELVRKQFTLNPIFKKLNVFDFMGKAQEVINWISEGGLPEKIKNSSYGHNLQVLIKRKAVSDKDLGIIIPAAQFYNNYLTEKLSNTGNSVFQGKVGERIERDLILRKTIPIDSMYGTQYITVLNDIDGNVYKWKTSSRTSAALNETYKAKMTVKDHENYRDVNQTSVLRVKFPDLDLIEKIHTSMTAHDFTKIISKISDPHMKVHSRGVDLPFEKLLETNQYFHDPEKVYAYLNLPKTNIQTVIDNTKLINDLREYSDQYKEENSEYFEKVVALISEKSDEDLSDLKVGSAMNCG